MTHVSQINRKHMALFLSEKIIFGIDVKRKN